MKKTIALITISILMLAFQNCSGDDIGGVIAGNPLSTNPEKLTISLNKFETPGTTARLCFRKVAIYVDELVGGPPEIPEDHYGAEVGTILDLNGNQAGVMMYEVTPQGREQLISAWPETSQTVTLTSANDVFLYELDIPDGTYSGAEFVIGEDSCTDLPGNSVEVANNFGTFQSHSFFQFNITSSFVVEDGKSSMQKLNTSAFYDDITPVQSNEALFDALLDKEY